MIAEADALLAHYIEPHPHKRGAAEASLKDYGVPVWALIGALPMVGGDLARLAEDYDVPLKAVRAAVAYYERHNAVIDDRLAANAG